MDNVTQSTPNTPEISLEIPPEILAVPQNVAQEQPIAETLKQEVSKEPSKTVEHQKIVDFIEGKSSDDPFAEKSLIEEPAVATQPEQSAKQIGRAHV